MRMVINFNLHFAIAMIIGFITFIAILIFGDVGFVLFSFFAILAFFKTKKADEREAQLFHKADTGTLVSVYLSMFLVYFFMPSINWLMVLACSFIFFRGLWGLLMFRFG